MLHSKALCTFHDHVFQEVTAGQGSYADGERKRIWHVPCQLKEIVGLLYIVEMVARSVTSFHMSVATIANPFNWMGRHRNWRRRGRCGGST